MTAEQTTCVPNHHAHYPGFAGLSGLLAALSMIGRGSDARLVEQLSALRSDDTVLDIGCGPGAAVRRAARLGAAVTGVDPAPVMLRVARLLTRSSGQVRYLIGAAESLPVPDGSASVVWAVASVHHWADLDTALREAGRVLTPGGRLVAVERRTQPGARGHASHGWTDDQARAFEDLCLRHGFVDPQVGRHTTGHRTTLSVTVRAA